jgi:hypothetical protein
LVTLCSTLAVVVLIVYSWVAAVRYGIHEGDVAQRCHPQPGVVVLHVARGDVRYAHRMGWPRVMSRGDRLGFAPALDHSRQAGSVRVRVAGLCRDQRFRLVAR